MADVPKSSCNCTVSALPAINSSDFFTRNSVLGTFFTLQLCLLTQPNGSLLFLENSGWLWRVNPIASLIEAILVFWYLAGAIYNSWEDGDLAVLEELQITSKALLILRGASGQDEVTAALHRLDVSLQIDQATNADQSTAASSSARLGSDSMLTRFRKLASQASTHENRTVTSQDNHKDSPQILRNVLGSHVSAHRELQIDVFTTVTVLFVFIKLVATRGNTCFMIAGIFQILGWTSIQALLILLHIRDMDKSDLKAAKQLTRTLDTLLNAEATTWKGLFLVLHLMVFGYPAYLATQSPWLQNQTKWYFLLIKGLLFVLDFMISISVMWFALVGGFVPLVLITSWVRFLYCAFWAPFAGIVILAGSKYIHIDLGNELDPTGFFLFQPGSILDHVINEGMARAIDAVHFLALSGALLMVYHLLFYAPKLLGFTSWVQWRKRIVVGNVLFTITVLTIYLLSYDETNTYKPWWTELLG